MALIAGTNERKFELPPEGMHPAVCVDVVDLGDVLNQRFGKTEHKCRIVWQIDKTMADGRRYIISRRFTVSMHEKSALRPFLETWAGRAFSEQEAREYDVENFLGMPGMLQVLYSADENNTYANVNMVVPWTAQFGQPLQPFDYTRVIDRESQPQQGQGAQQSGGQSGGQGRGATGGPTRATSFQNAQPQFQQPRQPQPQTQPGRQWTQPAAPQPNRPQYGGQQVGRPPVDEWEGTFPEDDGVPI